MRRRAAVAQNQMHHGEGVLHGREVLHGGEGVLGTALLLTAAFQGAKGGVHALGWVQWVGAHQQHSLDEGKSPGLERASWLWW